MFPKSMALPVLRGTIARRILVNFRAEPPAVQALLPPGLRPQLYRGHALAGVCLIRLEKLRPQFASPPLGLASENAAHRFAVEWDEGASVRAGVFIRRRDTSSLLSTLAGGRLFPGEHHRADFRVCDQGESIDFEMASRDGATSVRLLARSATILPPASVFASLQESSAFFEAGSLGFSARSGSTRLDGMRLQTQAWRVQPLDVQDVHSSFFFDPKYFPPGSIAFDHALLMRGIEHEWHAAASPF